MKAIKYNVQSIFSKILSFCLALLGFSSCGSEIVEQPCEYGTPSAKFVITGKVVSEETKNPVQNIKVTLSEVSTWKDGLGINYENNGAVLNTRTKVDGSFQFEYSGFPSNKKYKYLLEDIDGTANGLFESKLDSVLFTNPKFTNGDGKWYDGQTTQNLGTIEIETRKVE